MRLEAPLWIDKIRAEEDARGALTAVLNTKHEVQRFTLGDALKVSLKSWVFRATINGEDAVVKRFFDGDVPQVLRNLKVELDFLERSFDDPRYQANRCLYTWPEDGIAVLSFAPGKRLGDEIAQASGDARRQLVWQSGEWLRRYCEFRKRDSRFGPRHWVKKMTSVKTDRVSVPADRLLLDRLRASVVGQTDAVRGVPVVQAATHSDYVGLNAHYHQGTIYGVDIQGESWLAVAKDVARFLVWLQIHVPISEGGQRYGIALEYIDPFLESGVLSAQEQVTTLPFLIGEQLNGRFVEVYARPHLRDITRAAIEMYLA
ncbi:hypothetical protein SAMN04488040_0882 [Sulfitobacter marinus]|uniref:Phosphotransferase enzyme family protein n=1 Tax=Sulfitobacter marinus TaxID=394264 RepID=A0A1I6QRK8_9RHOB|nr:hypothetical protein [Sulfitobacter marinus]SFS55073.1 hypothetical protein SAMN04488040_0882 [Sulfitobacter marinus]